MRINLLLILCLGWLVVACSSRSDSSGTQQAEQEAPAETPQAEKNIVFFGNSLTAGYGLKPEQSFPSLIQQRIDSLGLPYRVVNAGVSGETTSNGLERIDWVLKQPVDIFVLELGANDGLRGINTQETRKNLQAMIDKVRAQYPEAQIVLAGMLVPPNMGPEFSKDFASIYPELAESNKTSLIPFLLDGVAGKPELNLPDGIHPTVDGQKIVANNVWRVLKPLMLS